jgi:putative ABC transport system substrate-binding protein
LAKDFQEVAPTKGLRILVFKASTEREIDATFDALVQGQVGALVLGSDLFFNSHYKQIVALTRRDAIPAIDQAREFADLGGLISYGPNLEANYRELGVYVGKILRGTRAADLPVQQPTTFKMVINLKAAKALGLTVPPGLLARADELIE